MSIYSAFYKRVLFPSYEEVLRGRSTLRYLEEMEASQWLSPEEMRGRQWEKLQGMLRYCESQVPYYRKVLAGAGIRASEIQSPDDFAEVPLLSKEEVGNRIWDRVVSLLA